MTSVPVKHPEKSFHIYMFGFLDETSQRGRLARCLLHHVRSGDWEPNRVTAAALRRARLDWCLTALPLEYQRYAGGELVNMEALAPAVVETKPEVPKPPKPPKLVALPMPEGKKFIGVVKTRSGTWMAQISINGKVKQLGRSHDPFVCAQAYDAAARANPSKTKKRELNFFVDDPLACSPEPHSFNHSMKAA